MKPIFCIDVLTHATIKTCLKVLDYDQLQTKLQIISTNFKRLFKYNNFQLSTSIKITNFAGLSSTPHRVRGRNEFISRLDFHIRLSLAQRREIVFIRSLFFYIAYQLSPNMSNGF